MIYLLDTDSVIFMIRSQKMKRESTQYNRSQKLIEKIKAEFESGSTVGISAITKAELEYGAAKSEDPEKELSAVEKLLAPFEEFDFDTGMCPRHYGDIRVELERAGKPIGSMDFLIAAHALALGATLVSNNSKHFKRVKGLAIENWTIATSAAEKKGLSFLHPSRIT